MGKLNDERAFRLRLGPLVIQNDAISPKPPYLLNYYWRGRYLMTSGRSYVILRLGARIHVFWPCQSWVVRIEQEGTPMERLIWRFKFLRHHSEIYTGSD